MLGSRLASVSVALVVRHVAMRDQGGLLKLFCGTSVQMAHDAYLTLEVNATPMERCLQGLLDRAVGLSRE